MTKNELKTLRMNIMGGMNAYVHELGDEDILDYWHWYGLPDEVTEEMLAEYAEDEEIWISIIQAFASVVRWD